VRGLKSYIVATAHKLAGYAASRQVDMSKLYQQRWMITSEFSQNSWSPTFSCTMENQGMKTHQQ